MASKQTGGSVDFPLALSEAAERTSASGDEPELDLGAKMVLSREVSAPLDESDAFRLYLADMSRHRLMSHEETVQLAKIMAKSKRSMVAQLARIPSASAQALQLCRKSLDNGVPLSQLLDTGPRYATEDQYDGASAQPAQVPPAGREQLLERIGRLEQNYTRWKRRADERSVTLLSDAFIRLEPNIHLLRRVGAHCRDLATRLAPERAVGAAQAVRQLELATGTDRSTLNEASAWIAEADARYSSAWQKMVQANLRLVIAVARRFSAGSVPLEDLVQEGNVGLFRAVEKFDYRLGYRFSTYASFWIRQAVTKALVNHGRTMRVPAHMNDKIVKLYHLRAALQQALGRVPTTAELAECSELPLETVRLALERGQSTWSLDSPIREGESGTLYDSTPDSSDRPAADVAYGEQLRSQIATLLDRLTPREALILRLRHGIDDIEPMTLDQFAKVIGVSRERVRQLEARAVRVARNHIKAELAGISEAD